MSTTATPTVHPRACGERSDLADPEFAAYGSSPRVRGTRYLPSFDSLRARFIPARAGNARAEPGAPSIDAVHPRACGERRSGGTLWTLMPGSSPRVRGTRVYSNAPTTRRRFIPARAGNAAWG